MNIYFFSVFFFSANFYDNADSSNFPNPFMNNTAILRGRKKENYVARNK